MKYIYKKIAVMLILILCTACLYGCRQNIEKLTCPFTDITWENTLDDIISYEGSETTNTYESTYSGITYVYSKEYDGYTGTVKYMFDDRDKLVCMAWTYITDSMDELDSLYNHLLEETQDKYGKHGYENENTTSKGNVWYLEDGNITLSAMTTDSAKSIQYSFVHPDVAAEKPE